MHWVPKDARNHLDLMRHEFEKAKPPRRCECVSSACTKECQCQDNGQRCNQNCACVDLDGQNAMDEVQVYDRLQILDTSDQLIWYNPPSAPFAQAEMSPATTEPPIVFDRTDEISNHQSKEDDHASYLPNEAVDETVLQMLSGQATFRHEDFDIGWESTILNLDQFEVGRSVSFRFVFGNGSDAVYSPIEDNNDLMDEEDEDSSSHNVINPQVFLTLIEIFNSRDLESHLLTVCSSDRNAQAIGALRAFAAAAELYHLLPDASVTLQAISSSLIDLRWAQDVNVKVRDGVVFDSQLFPSKMLTRPEAFAAVASFESGVHDIDPRGLGNITAMCSRDSIYAAAPLLCDAYEQPAPFELRRIVGSIGRAGIAMLMPPQHPRIREPEIESWHLIPHADYDGIDLDGFGQTSLHLSFTGYDEVVPGANAREAQDIEVFFLESVVSVYDRSKWVGDLDVLFALSDGRLKRAKPCWPCVHTEPGQRHQKHHLTSIDGWKELLEPPKNSMVVRAHNNWLSRLAAAAISIQLGNTTWILPPGQCWHAVLEQTRQEDKEKTRRKDKVGKKAYIN